MRFDEQVAACAQAQPNKVAIVFGEETVSYAQLHARVRATSALLANELGLVRGDRIACLALNHPEYPVLLASAAQLGLTLVPLNWRLAMPELGGIVENAQPRIIFHDARHTESAATLAGSIPGCLSVCVDDQDAGLPAQRADCPSAPDVDVGQPGDTLLMVYTSGTTGTPKGALLPQRSLASNIRMSQKMHDLGSAF